MVNQYDCKYTREDFDRAFVEFEKVFSQYQYSPMHTRRVDMNEFNDTPYWTMIQGELGCRTCKNFDKDNVGVPCTKYNKISIKQLGDGECPFKEVAS